MVANDAMVMIHRSSLSTAVNGANPRNDSAEGTSSNIGEPTEQPSSEGTTPKEGRTTVTSQRSTTPRTGDQSRRTSQNPKTTTQNANTGSESTTSPPDVIPTETEKPHAGPQKGESKKGPNFTFW